MRTLILCFSGILLFSAASGYSAFTEVAGARGVSDTNLAQGVSFVDIDNDDDQDMSLAIHDAGVRVFINDGTGNFTSSMPFTLPVRGGTAIWFDYDRDNDLDVFVGYAFVPSHFYQNNAGTYTEVSTLLSATVGDYDNRFCAIAGDFDKNGFADLCLSPFSSGSGVTRIYSQTAGTFTNTGTPIATPIVTSRSGNGIDYDNDGDMDIYIPGDNLASLLWRNDGAGAWTNVAPGTPLENGSLPARGAAWGDLDTDGDLDCVIANSAGGNAILRNNAGTFVAVTGTPVNTGITAGISPVLFDYDNDGDLDVFMHTLVGSPGGPGALFRNDGAFTFVDVTATDAPGFASDLADGRGAAVADIDNDGDLDLYRANGIAAAPSFLYLNGTNNNNWLKVKLATTFGDKQCFGARISVFNAGTSTLRGFSQIQSQTAYLSQNSFVQHFGVPSAGTYDVSVYFPYTNATATVTNVAATQTVTVNAPAPATGAQDWMLFN